MNETIAILGAVTEEIAGIKREINISDRVRLDKSEAWFGKYQGRNIVLVRTGVGRKRAQNATQQVIDKFNPEVIISMGYAGALTEGLNVGDMFVASTILSPESDSNSFEMDDPKNLLRITSLVFSDQDELICEMKDQFCAFLIHKIGNHFNEMSPEDFKIFIQTN